ncbi:unnamed protein product, partial [Laminaria digitata]
MLPNPCTTRRPEAIYSEERRRWRLRESLGEASQVFRGVQAPAVTKPATPPATARTTAMQQHLQRRPHPPHHHQRDTTTRELIERGHGRRPTAVSHNGTANEINPRQEQPRQEQEGKSGATRAGRPRKE